MTDYMLDTGVLGYVCHPRRHADVRAWFHQLLNRRPRPAVLLPAIADYELRRSLLRSGATTGLWKLDHLATVLDYVSLDDATLKYAARLWADLRRRGLPTADDIALDGDVILAAQARVARAVVITDNPEHLGRLVPVARWQDV